jgi:hypothetical protein
MVKPTLNVLEACHRLALSEGAERERKEGKGCKRKDRDDDKEETTCGDYAWNWVHGARYSADCLLAGANARGGRSFALFIGSILLNFQNRISIW